MIEKNIVFIYPLSQKLKELKEELESEEEESGFTIYELDSVDEYGQLIGVMEHSITFSSDIKKTESYLENSKQFVKSKTSRNFLVQDKTVLPHIFSKLQRIGLNEIIQEEVPLKNINHKIKMFFSPFEQAEKKAEEAKNKAVTEQVIGSGLLSGKEGKKETYNSQERLRVEKMATFDEPEKTKPKRKKSGLDLNMMLGGFASNFVLKKNPTSAPVFQSPFDNIQRKNVNTFDPVNDLPKLKKAKFDFLSPELKQGNPFKNFEIRPPGELNQGKGKKLDLAEGGPERKNVNFKEVESEINRKRAKFEEQHREMNKKRAKFDEALKELEKKKIVDIENQSENSKKRKTFEEQLRDFNKRKVDLDDLEKNLEKKKKEFEEIEIEYQKKKGKLEEVDLDLEKKNGIFEECDLLNKKKQKKLDELEELHRKAKKLFEIELEQKKVKDQSLEFAQPETKKRGTFEESGDLDKKDGVKLEDVEFEKKKLKFEEVELGKGEHKKLDLEDTELKKKKGTEFKDNELKKKNSGMEFSGLEYERKDGRFDEVKPESRFKDIQNMKIGEKSFDRGEELLKKEKKEGEEQTLDYSKFKKNKNYGEFKGEEEENLALERKRLEKILEEPEYSFYENESFALEYLVILNDFLLKDEINSLNLFKFVHFALIKEYVGDISFYLISNYDEENPENTSSESLYLGHQLSKNIFSEDDYNRYVATNLSVWQNVKLPTWKDETYQIEQNEFIYPYFEDGEPLGFAVAHFKETVKNHSDAFKIELIAMSVKGVILEEFQSKGDK